MPLILAIEPDRRQAAQLSVVVRKRVHAELILVETTERALDAIGNRMPDLVLVPALLSPQDDAALAAALRVIAAAARVQMLTIPVLGTPRPAVSAGGMLSALRRKPRAAEPDGCDPAVFAEQIASYLEHVDQERPRGVAHEALAHETVARQTVAHQTVAHAAVADTAEADPQPSYESPSLRMAAAEHASAVEYASIERETETEQASPIGEDTVNQEWLAALPVEAVEAVDTPEAESAAMPDEGVSFALVEAVRALFSTPAPAPVEAEPEIEEPVESFPDAALVAAESVEVAIDSPEVAANSVEKDEWVAVDELIAALQLMPLAAIEITDDDEWIAPAPHVPQRAAEKAEAILDDASSPVPVAAKSEREWVALIESLRHDVERLRVERSEKPARKAVAVAAGAARPDKADKVEKAAKPVQDEWGFFDPQQCGFEALLAKLDEVTETDDGQIKH